MTFKCQDESGHVFNSSRFLSGLSFLLQVLWHFWYILGSSSRSVCSIPSVKWQHQCWSLPNPALFHLVGAWIKGCLTLQCGWENSTVSLCASLPSQTEFQLSIWQWWMLGMQELVSFAAHLQAGLVIPGQVSTCAQSEWTLTHHLLAVFPSPHHLHLGKEEKINKWEEDNKENKLSGWRFLTSIDLWKYNKKYAAWDGGFVGCRITNCLSPFQRICLVSIYQISCSPSSPGYLLAFY